MAPPEFPPPFVIERTRSLGFGTGPWSREQLVAAWNATTADKYISDAKAAGWLVSPSRAVYYVPAAQDVMLVAWLPEPIRTEFLISRTLAAANIRAWCLSAWCRDQGLALPDPVFVTDLTQVTDPPRATIDRRALRTKAADLATRQGSIPFLDNLLIVPAMPVVSAPVPRAVLVPESPEVMDRRQRETQMGQALLGLGALIALAVDKDVPEFRTEFERLDQREANARGVPYAVDGAIEDVSWVTALLATIGTSRIEELVVKTLRPKMKGKADAIQKWASLIGPPQPVSAWKVTLQEGPFPYLLVPPSLWAQMGADQAARRYRMLDQLARG